MRFLIVWASDELNLENLLLNLNFELVKWLFAKPFVIFKFELFPLDSELLFDDLVDLVMLVFELFDMLPFNIPFCFWAKGNSLLTSVFWSRLNDETLLDAAPNCGTGVCEVLYWPNGERKLAALNVDAELDVVEFGLKILPKLFK